MTSGKDKVLVIGACGQIGPELVAALRSSLGEEGVVAADIRTDGCGDTGHGPFEPLDVLDAAAVHDVIRRHGIGRVYLLAAMLSAVAEEKAGAAWRLNMEGLFNLLELARKGHIDRLFWPSSIAVFGPKTPRDSTPQHTVTEPTTVYGISKLAGERWCEYYFLKYGVDVRSLRYPGIIGHRSLPGGGTTDYAVHIFHEAAKGRNYECFLKEDAVLPMMYMSDAVRATLELMEAPAAKIGVRSSYNVAGTSFSPSDVAEAIRRRLPDFTCSYHPDHRQRIADSWPRSIDDSCAAKDWGWRSKYDLEAITGDMLAHLAVGAS